MSKAAVKEEGGSGVESWCGLTMEEIAKQLETVPIRKLFPKYGYFDGDIVGFNTQTNKFRVVYKDEDEETMELAELAKYLPSATAVLAKEFLRSAVGGGSGSPAKAGGPCKRLRKLDKEEELKQAATDEVDSDVEFVPDKPKAPEVVTISDGAAQGRSGPVAELHYQGEAPPGDGLPAVVVLDQTQRHSLDVGRQSDCSVVLDSRAQALMISRRHATLTCDASTGQWKLTDLNSTNGVLYNGIKVTEANLSNNDIVTFGGAKSTKVGALPSEKAPKSIYVYKFVVHDDNVSSSQTTPFSGQKRDRSASEREEDRERKRQQREEQEAEERANREQQERERREREEREQQQREEALARERERLQQEEKERRDRFEREDRERKERLEREEKQREEHSQKERKRIEQERKRLEMEALEEEAARRKKLENEKAELLQQKLKLDLEKREWQEKQRLEKEEKQRLEKEAKEKEEQKMRDEEQKLKELALKNELAKKEKELALKERELAQRAKESNKKAAVVVVDLTVDDKDDGESAAQASASSSRPRWWQEDGCDNHMKLFEVPKISDEYKEVLAIFDQDKTMKQQAWQLPIFIDTYDIVSLQRIQNPVLWDCYSALKNSKVKSNQEPNEIWTVHGSVQDSLDNIAANGFNRSYNGKNATVYGKGAYFAKLGNYSYAAQDQYAKPAADGTQKLILTMVIEGQKTVGNDSHVEPPYLNAKTRVRYDSTGDPSNTIVVTYKDQQAYPAYIVTFKRKPPQPVQPTPGTMKVLQSLGAGAAWASSNPHLQAAVTRAGVMVGHGKQKLAPVPKGSTGAAAKGGGAAVPAAAAVPKSLQRWTPASFMSSLGPPCWMCLGVGCMLCAPPGSAGPRFPFQQNLAPVANNGSKKHVRSPALPSPAPPPPAAPSLIGAAAPTPNSSAWAAPKSPRSPVSAAKKRKKKNK